jgi:hypothetical protein
MFRVAKRSQVVFRGVLFFGNFGLHQVQQATSQFISIQRREGEGSGVNRGAEVSINM